MAIMIWKTLTHSNISGFVRADRVKFRSLNSTLKANYHMVSVSFVQAGYSFWICYFV